MPTAWPLANSHDFLNCAVAYSPTEDYLYFSPEAFKAWSDGFLVINKSPLFNKQYPDLLFFNQFAIFIQRIKKYKSRYQLELSPKSKKSFLRIYVDYKDRLANYPSSVTPYAPSPLYYTCPYSGYQYAFKDILKDFTPEEIL